MAPYLDLAPELALQQKQRWLVPWHYNHPWFRFPSGTCNCSSCHHRVGEWNWFGACHGETGAYFTGTKVSWRLGGNLVSELGRVWEKMLKVIPRSLVHHSDFYCVTCVVLR
uniref:Uncharacterized protein n=2 Tax=Chinchilla lanigera TaxID=34839 RepID=A0A8C2WCX9_CHILA